MPSIFLSYARDDDETFVKRLYDDLVAHCFEVWWDRVSMPSRQLTFHQEIRDAIKVRDRVVLVVGPHAVTSDYVNQEWQWALEMGKCINPIIRLNGQQEGGGQIDGYAILPEQLKLVHAEDFRDNSCYKEHLENLVRQLSDPAPPLGKLIAVPTLPAHYRAQPERLRQLRDVLLVDLHKPIVITGAVARVGVQGMGGIGKSVLAAALARDPEVRRAFPDGIFWIGIGQHPNLIEIQRQTVKLLDGDPVFDDTQSGKTRLRELLEHRAVLLMLDDVWQSSDADAFDVVSLRSKLLLTTRDAGLVTSFTGISYQVQLPSPSEASALLATAARIPVDALPPIAEEIIDECGRLPLALALCGSMASKGQTWERILRMLREARLELIADRQEINEMHRSIWRAMEASISILSPDEQRRFTELAVFSFDTTVPEEAVFTLWHQTGGLDDLASSVLLISFYERSLVLIDRTAGSTGTGTARISLHDLLFDFATRSAIKNLGDIAVLNNQLIDAYWQKCPDGWPSGPDDGYFLQHLCQHLVTAGKQDQLISLLINFAWMERKVETSLLYSLIDDYDYVNDDDTLILIQNALRLSINPLAHGDGQLLGQLIGRLGDRKENEIKSFLDRATRLTSDFWLLLPKIATLRKPDIGILFSWRAYDSIPACKLAISQDGNCVAFVESDRVVFRRIDSGIEVTSENKSHEFLQSQLSTICNALPVVPMSEVLRGINENDFHKQWVLSSKVGEFRIVAHIDWKRNSIYSSSRTVTGYTTNVAQEIQLTIGNQRYRLEGNDIPSPCFAVALSADGRFLAMSGYNGNIVIFELQNTDLKSNVQSNKDLELGFWQLGCPVYKINFPGVHFEGLAINSLGNRIVALDNNGILNVLKASGVNTQIRESIKGKMGWNEVPCQCLYIDSTGRNALVLDKHGNCSVWNTSNGNELLKISNYGTAQKSSRLFMREDGNFAIWVEALEDLYDGFRVRGIDLYQGIFVFEIETPGPKSSDADKTPNKFILDDETWYAYPTPDKGWINLDTGRQQPAKESRGLGTLSHKRESRDDLAFSCHISDDKWSLLVHVSYDDSVVLTFTPDDKITHAVISEDGSTLVIACASGQLHFLELTWREKRQDKLSETVRSGSLPLRVSSVRALASADGSPSTSGLLCMVNQSDTNPYVRYHAVLALGSIDGSEAVEELIRSLKDESSIVREQAVRSLAHHHNASAVSMALDDKKIIVRRAAVQELGRIGDVAFIPRLIESFNDEELQVRLEAVQAIGAIESPVAIDVLFSLLKDPRVEVRRIALKTLSDLGIKEIKPFLIEALSDSDSTIQGEAARLLTSLNWVPESPDLFVRLSVANGRSDNCIKIGSAAVPELIRLLDCPDSCSVGAIYRTLGNIGDRSAIPSLLTAIKHEAGRENNVDLKCAIWAIGTFRDESTVQPLIEVFGDVDRQRRIEILSALRNIGGIMARDFLLNTLDHEDIYIRQDAARALVNYRNDASVNAALIRALKQGNLKAGETLGHLGCYDAIEDLVKVLESRNIDLKCAAIRALGEIGDSSTIMALIDTDTLDNSVTTAIADALGKLGSSMALEWLLHTLSHGSHDAYNRPQYSPVGAAARALMNFFPPEDQIIHLAKSMIYLPQYGSYKEFDIEVLHVIRKVLDKVNNPAAIRDLTSVAEYLVEAISLEPYYAHREISEILLILGKPIIPVLIQNLKCTDGRARAALVSVLGDIGSYDAVPELSRMLDDPEGHVRLATVKALRSIGSPDAIGALRRPILASERITLFRAGAVPQDVMEAVANQIRYLIDQVLGPHGATLTVIFDTVPEPILHNERSNEWRQAFSDLRDQCSAGSIGLIVTSIGLWENDPPRFIFAENLWSGVTILSTMRFDHLNYSLTIDRMAKAGIKSFGMALGLSHCQDPQCTMAYHRIPEDFDKNTGLCKTCTNRMKRAIGMIIGKWRYIASDNS